MPPAAISQSPISSMSQNLALDHLDKIIKVLNFINIQITEKHQMKNLLAILLVCVSVSVFAQDKAKPASGYTRLTIAEASGFEAYTTNFPPGAISPMAKRPIRVIYVLSGGTLQRTYADGRKVDITYKTGETKIINDDVPYELKNVSNSTVKLYCVRNK